MGFPPIKIVALVRVCVCECVRYRFWAMQRSKTAGDATFQDSEPRSNPGLNFCMNYCLNSFVNYRFVC